ncbi:hypothetical protein BH23PLA1_BH23PLA1_12750 [soil metagenome]
MNRRTFLQTGLGTAWAFPLMAAMPRPTQEKLQEASNALSNAIADGPLAGAVLYVRSDGHEFARAFGSATTPDAMFLLGSISKPITVAALLTLHDQGRFSLDDPAQKYLPEFHGEGRDRITIRQLLTHVSGLPDQLPENDTLRSSHAPLSEFVSKAIQTPLLFAPGSRYEYSSMAILLAAEIAQRLSGVGLLAFVQKAVFDPLEMKHSALGLGRFPIEALMPCQTEHAAPEAGAGDPEALNWDWNSLYWRQLGAPWGGVHASAPDVGRFLDAFLHPEGKLLSPATARLMIQNHNPEGFPPRGLGFALGASLGGPGGSERTFGHTGSTGTLAWADPESETICVVLTTLPGQAIDPHPRAIASERVAEAVR